MSRWLGGFVAVVAVTVGGSMEGRTLRSGVTSSPASASCRASITVDLIVYGRWNFQGISYQGRAVQNNGCWVVEVPTRNWRVCTFRYGYLRTTNNPGVASWVFDDTGGGSDHINDAQAISRCATTGRGAAGDVYMAPVASGGRVQWRRAAPPTARVRHFFAELYSGGQVDNLFSAWLGQRTIGAPIINVSPSVSDMAQRVLNVCRATTQNYADSHLLGLYYSASDVLGGAKLGAIVAGLNACTGG